MIAARSRFAIQTSVLDLPLPGPLEAAYCSGEIEGVVKGPDAEICLSWCCAGKYASKPTHTTGQRCRRASQDSGRPLTLEAQLRGATLSSPSPQLLSSRGSDDTSGVESNSLFFLAPVAGELLFLTKRARLKIVCREMPAASESPPIWHQPMSRFPSDARLPAPLQHRCLFLFSLLCDVLDGGFPYRGPQSSGEAGDGLQGSEAETPVVKKPRLINSISEEVCARCTRENLVSGVIFPTKVWKPLYLAASSPRT